MNLLSHAVLRIFSSSDKRDIQYTLLFDALLLFALDTYRISLSGKSLTHTCDILVNMRRIITHVKSDRHLAIAPV